MSKPKKIVIIFLLVAVTVSIITIPIFVNSLSFEYLKSNEKTWTHKYTGKKLTPKDVAEYYCSSDNHYEIDEYKYETVYKATCELVSAVFNGDKRMHKHFKELIRNSMNYEQKYRIVTIDNTPKIFSEIAVNLIGENENIEMVFEEKSGIIISFVYDSKNIDTLNRVKKIFEKNYISRLEKMNVAYIFNTEETSEFRFVLSDKKYEEYEDY